MTEPRAGLRERKKEDARRQIIHKANRLFRKHGYEGVTLEQIADACVMSVRTILRYFSTKEALALAVEHDLLESFRSRLANRETDAVTCWRDFQVETLHLMESAEARQRMIAIFSTSATLAEFSLIGQTYQDILADAIAEESGDVPPLETAVFATLLVSSSSAAFRRWLMYDEPFDIVVLDKNFDRVCTAFDVRKPARGQKAKSRAAGAQAG
ncbi:TetR/AcrR family transcriptional regulator [Mycolicibacterium pyrenivorans]|uniref:TetR/AcrR family transcriptional regulator n=1 Tax=Mycolicibacterium pyrenivorans TaxID=187102 RepID=UPI0021F27B6F|nr:TetR/AcrR family transcriptional regulator [Mycolicibacterium pyrenivorans]MCV7151677.1 TetR/AcrR family transcriptional regulator [Mycolicibacterium pyrenivorans]